MSFHLLQEKPLCNKALHYERRCTSNKKLNQQINQTRVTTSLQAKAHAQTSVNLQAQNSFM